jgi:DNA-binding response OmpR family regulator
MLCDPSGVASGHKKKILIIDDEEPIRRLLSQVLEKCGFEVLTAADGECGLAMAYTEQPHLILVDLVMPGLSGRETIAQLKSDPVAKEVPVMVLTAESTRENVMQVRALGAIPIVAKMDFELASFLKKVLAILGESHPKEPAVPEPMAEADQKIGLEAEEKKQSPPAPPAVPSRAAEKKPEDGLKSGSRR